MDKKILLALIICVCICFCTAVICDTYKKSYENNTNIDSISVRLDSLKELIIKNKSSLVIYQDNMTNEVEKIDYITNDSAINLFKDLLNEQSTIRRN